jgi:hypothetical protein
VEVIEVFPVTRVGKVDKSALRVQISEQLQRELSMKGQTASSPAGGVR